MPVAARPGICLPLGQALSRGGGFPDAAALPGTGAAATIGTSPQESRR
ncbi:hypothetical protein JMJ56_06655 [Belnapia sp. T18]|uniref:Uncharacterized protein n=1 Tax=Belnapia arida TaxID=2804533 RepID=A0ABS1U301_9PROT|nr:hypothetical protein [Belnapia arida]MBL6077681.1 hypothetical protein [Belnapia arida]